MIFCLPFKLKAQLTKVASEKGEELSDASKAVLRERPASKQGMER